MHRALDHLLGSQEAFAQLLQAQDSSDALAVARELWGLALPLLQQVLRALLKRVSSQKAQKKQLKDAYMLSLRMEQAEPTQILLLITEKLKPLEKKK